MLALDHLRLHIKDLEPQAEVWGDTEKCLTHDDERRDVEEGIQGQIVEIQPVKVHETSDEGMEGEPESLEEVGDEHHPLAGLWGRDDLPRGRKPVFDLRRQVPRLM